MAGIDLENEGQRNVSIGKHWGTREPGLQCLETFSALICSVLNDIWYELPLGPGTSQLSYQSIKGSCQLCETLHKAAVIACKTQE